MHELTIAQSILDIVLVAAAEQDAAAIRRIRLLVGELTQVVPQSLEFGFAMLAAGTLAEGAQLEIVAVELTGRCEQCGLQFNIRKNRFICPGCSSTGITVLTGRELIVDLFEVEDGNKGNGQYS